MCNYFKSIHWLKRRSSLKVFLFIALELFEHFWQRVTQEIFLYNYFKIHPLVEEEMSFKGYSILNSGGDFIQQSGTV